MIFPKNKKYAPIYIAIFAIILIFGAILFINQNKQTPAKFEITNFEQCLEAGFPVQESYPRGCNANGQHFTEEIGNTNEKAELISLQIPRPNDVITSPLEIRGAARGTWFFEATFPVVLTNWDGLIIAEGYAEATSDWMTAEFVPFKATLEFENPSWEEEFSKRGSLILQKNNPSGLPENDDALEIPVKFE